MSQTLALFVSGDLHVYLKEQEMNNLILNEKDQADQAWSFLVYHITPFSLKRVLPRTILSPYTQYTRKRKGQV